MLLLLRIIATADRLCFQSHRKDGQQQNKEDTSSPVGQK
jgi:hypothetical protein